MEEKNKNVIVPTIIAIVTLVLLTVGATYAYFRVATDNAFGTPKIEASTPSIGSVALSTGSNLTMNLTAEQMMQHSGYFYEGDFLQACIEEAEEMESTPEDYGCYDISTKSVLYYASPNGTTTESYTENIGTASVSGEGSYNCTYTLTIDDNANSLYDKFQSEYANKSIGQILLTVNGVTYDFNTANLFPLTIDGKMNGITKDAPQYITAKLKLVNSKTTDQSNLAGQNITLEFGVEDFSCTAVEEQEQTAVQYILANASEEDLWDSTLEDDGYRYIGTNPDNYVCFGYTDTETDCDFTKAENTDKYAYRVIGIFEDTNGVEHVKLIKKESLNTKYVWHEEDADVDWNESDLYDKLSGDAFLTNTTYIPTGWNDKIATWNYTMTNTLYWEYILGLQSLNYNSITVQNVYLHEMNRSTKTNTVGEWKTASGKVSLMYVSDYLLSLGSSALDYTGKSNKATLKTGWMHIRNNDTSTSSSIEWTMTRKGGIVDGGYTVWNVDSYGSLDDEGYMNLLSFGDVARPVFYLTSDTTMSGLGTTESPFIVNK